MTRSVEQIRDEWLGQLLPQGAAWPKDPRSNLGGILLALAQPRFQVEQDIAALALEISPERSTVLLDDYRTLLGPDPFGRDQGSLTTEQWQALLFSRWTARGGQSIAYYEGLSSNLGVDVQIWEPVPAVWGDFVWGDGSQWSEAANDLFVWQVTLPNPETGLEDVFRANRQPDTEIVFRYRDQSGFGDIAFGETAFGG